MRVVYWPVDPFTLSPLAAIVRPPVPLIRPEYLTMPAVPEFVAAVEESVPPPLPSVIALSTVNPVAEPESITSPPPLSVTPDVEPRLELASIEIDPAFTCVAPE